MCSPNEQRPRPSEEATALGDVNVPFADGWIC